MPARRRLVAALLFALSTAWCAVVSLRAGVRGEPLGIQVPGSVRDHLLCGWGTGLSAPWPMVAVALGDALRRRHDDGPDRTPAVIGAAMTLGTAIEPVTWGRRARSRTVTSAIGLNLLVAAALIRAGLRPSAGHRTGGHA